MCLKMTGNISNQNHHLVLGRTPSGQLQMSSKQIYVVFLLNYLQNAFKLYLPHVLQIVK